jgi:hypothetical protein
MFHASGSEEQLLTVLQQQPSKAIKVIEFVLRRTTVSSSTGLSIAKSLAAKVITQLTSVCCTAAKEAADAAQTPQSHASDMFSMVISCLKQNRILATAAADLDSCTHNSHTLDASDAAFISCGRLATASWPVMLASTAAVLNCQEQQLAGGAEQLLACAASRLLPAAAAAPATAAAAGASTASEATPRPCHSSA